MEIRVIKPYENLNNIIIKNNQIIKEKEGLASNLEYSLHQLQRCIIATILRVNDTSKRAKVFVYTYF